MSQHPYGPPTAYPYQATPMVPRTNGMAIASLVFALLGFAIVPVILGHLALKTIKETGEGGSALAAIGLVLGYLQVAVVALMILLAMAGALGAFGG
jgi:hypothetical protein